MLRLERGRKGPSITISPREKEPLLSSYLLLALMLSCTLHLIWVVSFTIRSAPDDRQLAPLPPTFVEVEGSVREEKLHLAQFDPTQRFRGSLPRYIVEPEPPTPQFPTITQDSIPYETDLFSPSWSKHALFQTLRELPYSATEGKLPLEQLDPLLRIEVSGVLAERPLSIQPIEPVGHASAPRQRSQQVVLIYDVRVNDHDGRVCWWQRQETESSAIECVGRALLQELRFAPRRKAGVPDGLSSGTITIFAQVGSANDPTHPWHTLVDKWVSESL